MFDIDGILIDENIVKSYFSCDLKKCKGACCTFPGEFGAPIKDEEVELIAECTDAAREYLSPRSRSVLDKEGFYVGKPGKYTTVCINKRDCVFVYYDGSIALCALERAYIEGKTKFRKPVSCHLFPIRVGNYGGKYLYYEKIDECEPAIDNGRAEHKLLPCSVKEALIRSFGEETFKKIVMLTDSSKNNCC